MPEIKVTRELPVPLTPEEKAVLGAKLCEQLREHDTIVAEKSKHVAACNEKLKIVRKAVDRTRFSIETGSELRDVQCIERAGLTNGTVEVVRLDTGEIVETITDDPARADDVAQQELPITRPGKACDYCGNADGTHRNDVAHGYAHATANDAEDDDCVVPLTAAQREGLEKCLEEGGGTFVIEWEGRSYTLTSLADDEERDNGAEAIALLNEDDLDADTNEPESVSAAEMAEACGPAPIGAKKKGGKGKKDARATP